MAGLQRSAVSFRRQGSSGTIWDDKFLAGLVNQQKREQEEQNKKKNEEDKRVKSQQQGESEIKVEDSDDPVPVPVPVPAPVTIDRSRSNGRAHRTGRVSPAAIEPPSPRVSACGFCGAFGKSGNTRRRPPKSGKRVM